MSLACDYDCDYEPGMTMWHYPDSRSWRALDTFKRIPKCCSCGNKVTETGFGKDALEIPRFKVPEHPIEIGIYGEYGEIPRASYFMCFECGWRYLALVDDGYAVNIEDNMVALLSERDEQRVDGMAGCK